MAKTLSEIELTDRQKLSLSEQGILGPLLEFLSCDNSETKRVTVKCLECLSMMRQNGRKMIKEGFVAPLLELLYHRSSSSPRLREHVSATIMHLAESTISQQGRFEEEDELSLLESDEDIFKLFCLISLTGPDMQGNILRAFHAMCQSTSGSDIRTKLRQVLVGPDWLAILDKMIMLYGFKTSQLFKILINLHRLKLSALRCTSIGSTL